MSHSVKIALYAFLAVGLLLCTWGFLNRFHGSTDVPPEDPVPPTEEPVPAEKRDGTGAMMAYGALALVMMVGLGLMIAYDMSRYFAAKTEEFIFADGGEGARDPDYDEAEHVWANGEYLDAIQLMRDYLKRHPSHQFAALRIAEIYEKDLGNHLAAALEYEQILQQRLPAERWGWSAIHLANLYSGKLGKADQAEALLRRIINEYGQTAAARKARERLGEPEPAPRVAPPPGGPQDDASHLPPGFRPKKG